MLFKAPSFFCVFRLVFGTFLLCLHKWPAWIKWQRFHPKHDFGIIIKTEKSASSHCLQCMRVRAFVRITWHREYVPQIIFTTHRQLLFWYRIFNSVVYIGHFLLRKTAYDSGKESQRKVNKKRVSSYCLLVLNFCCANRKNLLMELNFRHG